jgi:hypothetical protein
MDAVLRLNKLDFIKAQLSSYGGEKKEYGERMIIRCPFHNDTNPSGSLSLNTTWAGSFKCYSCGAKANWDELAERLHLQPFKRSEPKEEYAIDLMARAQEFLSEKEEGYSKGTFKFWDLPANKKWRSIPTNLLIKLGGKLSIKWSDEYQRWGTTKFIYFPVNVNDEQVGFFRARLKKDVTGKAPSYLLAARSGSGNWGLSKGLWPFDHTLHMMTALGSKTVVLVEGQRDCLRLITLGIPAMCIFGTQSWSSSKAKLLELAGVRRVVLLMDGDESGIKATNNIETGCTGMFKIAVLKLWDMDGSPYRQFLDHENPTKAAKEAGVELWDPQNCPKSVLEKLKHKFF